MTVDQNLSTKLFTTYLKTFTLIFIICLTPISASNQHKKSSNFYSKKVKEEMAKARSNHLILTLDASNFFQIKKTKRDILTLFIIPTQRGSAESLRKFRKLAEKYSKIFKKLEFGIFDAELYEEQADWYDIQEYPGLVLFKEGRPIIFEKKNPKDLREFLEINLNEYEEKMKKIGLSQMTKVKSLLDWKRIISEAKNPLVLYTGNEPEKFSIFQKTQRGELDIKFFYSFDPNIKKINDGSTLTLYRPDIKKRFFYKGKWESSDIKNWVNTIKLPLVMGSEHPDSLDRIFGHGDWVFVYFTSKKNYEGNLPFFKNAELLTGPKVTFLVANQLEKDTKSLKDFLGAKKFPQLIAVKKREYNNFEKIPYKGKWEIDQVQIWMKKS